MTEESKTNELAETITPILEATQKETEPTPSAEPPKKKRKMTEKQQAINNAKEEYNEPSAVEKRRITNEKKRASKERKQAEYRERLGEDRFNEIIRKTKATKKLNMEILNKFKIFSKDVKLNSINNLAAVLVHESFHLYLRKREIILTPNQEEYFCYYYELGLINKLSNVEDWLIQHTKQQIINNSK